MISRRRAARGRQALLGLLGALASAPVAHAGTVRAQIAVPADRSDPSTDGLWRIDNGVLPVLPRAIDPRSECLLVLSPRGKAPTKDARKEDVVAAELRGLRLVPAVIAVPLGATLEIKNEDRVPHTLLSVEPDGPLLPRPTPAGAVRSEHMQRPGVFGVIDDELPHLRGWVIVTDGGVALRPDDKGVVKGEVPDGRYTARLFYRGAYVVERDVEVSARPLELQLAVPGRGPPKPPERAADKTPDKEAAKPEAAATDGGAR